MTDEEALKEIDRQEKRFAAAGFGNGLRLAKSAREYYQTIVKCRQKSAEVAAECAAANEKAVAMTAETDRMEAEARQMLKEVSGAIHYYNSKRIGEIDFIVEQGGKVLPLEAKSGEDCESHVALTKLMKAQEYGIDEAYVLNKFERVREVSGIVYCPIYFLMFIRPTALPDKLIYRV